MEADFHCLDVDIAVSVGHSTDVSLEGPAIAELVQCVRSAYAAEIERQELEAQAEECRSWLVSAQLELDAPPPPDSEAAQTILTAQRTCAELQQRVKEKLEETSANKDKVKKALPKGSGSCGKELEKSLQALGVQRQAYFSGSFVGNHIDKLCKVKTALSIFDTTWIFWCVPEHGVLVASSGPKYLIGCTILIFMQEKSIQVLASIPVNVATAECPSLLDKARSMQKKYIDLWTKFGICHREYNAAKTFSDDDVDKLGKYSSFQSVHVLFCM